MTIVREWRNEEWCNDEHARTQWELQQMAKDIMSNAENVDGNPTAGHSREDISRVYKCTSSLLPNVEYIIHMSGFKVEDIIELVKR